MGIGSFSGEGGYIFVVIIFFHVERVRFSQGTWVEILQELKFSHVGAGLEVSSMELKENYKVKKDSLGELRFFKWGGVEAGHGG